MLVAVVDSILVHCRFWHHGGKWRAQDHGFAALRCGAMQCIRLNHVWHLPLPAAWRCCCLPSLPLRMQQRQCNGCQTGGWQAAPLQPAFCMHTWAAQMEAERIRPAVQRCSAHAGSLPPASICRPDSDTMHHSSLYGTSATRCQPCTM